ncbi:carbohydrate ABC transporter permease [Gracilibacillus sp. HCP3S3_G5_1]|uniref:carbohydrate ABC transporter permease n=1 Tax=unclassified Gracilibacillus TaxID=2625209 RepID=UPI003F88BDF7
MIKSNESAWEVKEPLIKRAFTKRKIRSIWKPYLYLLPGLILLWIWMYYPLLSTFTLAFQKWSMVPGTSPIPVGFDNFIRLLSNKDFGVSIVNTIFYTIGLLPFSIIIPLFLAVATHKMQGFMKNVYRTMFFIPLILAPVSIGAIWRWLFHPTNGLVNQVLLKLGLIDTNIAFFTDPTFAKWLILIITGWKMIGFSTIMFSAALTGISKEYYEAISLDGANRFQHFKDLTLPLLSPMILLVLMMSILFSSQWTFAYIDILTQGGPFGSTTNIYYEMYKYGFSKLDVGLSAAAALLFFIVFSLIAFVLNLIQKRYAFYDN